MMFDREIAAFRLILCEDKVLCVEGVSKLLAITEERVELKLRKKILEVSGTGIRIREIQAGRILLEGVFSAFSLKGAS